MAITLATIGRNAGSDAIVDLVDAGAGAGDYQIGTTAFASILATIAAADPAFGSASVGVATMLGTPLADASADNTGTAAVWRARDSDTNVVWTGPVATSGGGDMTLEDPARDAAIDAIVALASGGDVQFATDSGFGTILLTVPLNTPAWGASSGGAAALDVSPALTANAAVGGTATAFRVRTSGASEIWQGTVGTSGADWNFDSNVWVASQPITLSAYSFTLPATTSGSDGTLVINNTAIVATQNVEITSGSFDFPATQ
jgi:hypothetical protein